MHRIARHRFYRAWGINIMIANFGNIPNNSLKEQQVATPSPRPSAIVESNVAHAQISGIEANEKHAYKERNLHLRYTALIDRNLATTRNSHMKEEK